MVIERGETILGTRGGQNERGKGGKDYINREGVQNIILNDE